MNEPTPLSNAAADIADLVERYRDDDFAATERARLAQRLAADPVFRAEFRAHLRLAQTLTASLESDPEASARRADLAVAALSPSRRLALWRAVTSEIDAGTQRQPLHPTWWRWAGASAAAAVVMMAIVPWMMRAGAQRPLAASNSSAVAAIPVSSITATVHEPAPDVAAPPSTTQPPRPGPVARVESVSVRAEPIGLDPIPASAIALPSVAPESTPIVVAVVPPAAPIVRAVTAAPARVLVASARGDDPLAGQSELPARGSWIAGGANVRRGARELPAHGLLALVPGDEIEIGDQGAALQPDDGIRLVCAAHARLVVSPSTGRRQVGRYVALVAGAISDIEVASGETLIVATDHGDVVAAGAKLSLSLHDGWLRCEVGEGTVRIGPQHRRIDGGSAAVLAGGRVLTVFGPGRIGAAVLGGGWTRRGAPWFPLVAQTTVRSPAALAALAGNGFDAVILASANDARVAVQAGLGVILELTPTILAQASTLHAQPGLLGWSVTHDGSPRSLQEALRTVTTLHRSDVGHAVIAKAGPGDPGRRLTAAVDALVTSDPALQPAHAPLARLTVSADAAAVRFHAFAALTAGACGLLVVDPQSQPEVVRVLLAEIAHVAPLIAAGERDALAAPTGTSAARWSDGHNTLLIAVNSGDQPAAIPVTGGWTNGLHPLATSTTHVTDGDESPLIAGVVTVPAHGVCVLANGTH